MTETPPAGQEPIRESLHDLEARIRSRPIGQKRQAVEEWALDHSGPSQSVEVAHHALVIRDLVRELKADAVADKGPKKLVILLHGIRDQGPWMEMVKARLEGPDVFVQPIDYEFFDAVHFITGWGTRAALDHVTERVRDTAADHPGVELTIIAHSFGTFLISKILLKYPDIHCARVVFCGAVVSKRFPFRRIPCRPIIVNECGDCDIWPVVAQGFSLWNSYGAAGVWGLRQSRVTDRFHDFHHSDYLKPDFVDKFWKPFIESGHLVASQYQTTRRDVPWGVSLLSFGWRLAWVFVAAICGCCLLVWLNASNLILGVSCSFVAIVSLVLIYIIVMDVRRFHSPVRAQP